MGGGAQHGRLLSLDTRDGHELGVQPQLFCGVDLANLQLGGGRNWVLHIQAHSKVDDYATEDGS